MKQFFAISAIGILASISAIADENSNYFGGSVAVVEYSESGISDDASLTALYGRFGTFFNENFSAEVRAGIGIGDDDVVVLGIPANVDLEHFFGAYVRGGIQASDAFYPYALIGFTRGELEATALGISVSESESDLSFGIGADINLSSGLTINLEYINLLDKDGAEVDGFTIGLAKSF